VYSTVQLPHHIFDYTVYTVYCNNGVYHWQFQAQACLFGVEWLGSCCLAFAAEEEKGGKCRK
jgi:hypothetical protein